MQQNVYYRNLKWTFEDLLPCYCYAIKTRSATIRQQVSQPVSAGKGANCAVALSRAPRSRLCPRPVTRRGEVSLKLFSPPLEKCVGHSLKNLGPSQKTLFPTWYPKLVTGLLCPDGPRVSFIRPCLHAWLYTFRSQTSTWSMCFV